MDPRRRAWALVLAACALSWLVACERSDDNFLPLQLSTDPLVFGDAYGEGVGFQPFLGTKLDAVQVATIETFGGSAAALRIDVPGPGTGLYAGGAFTAQIGRDFSSYNALRFQVRSDREATLDVVGLGNDNTGTSRFTVSLSNVAIGTSWTEVVIPIPRPSRLRGERGLFFFSEGFEGDTTKPYTIWIDEIEFTSLRSIANVRPTAPVTRIIEAFVGTTIPPQGRQFVFDVGTRTVVVDAAAGHLDFVADNDSVIAVDEERLRVVGPGEVGVRGFLGEIDANLRLEITGRSVPTEPAPTPTYPAGNVLALFSDAYTPVAVDTWSASFSRRDFPNVADLAIAGNAVKAYTNLGFEESGAAAIEFVSETLDVTGYDFFRFDVWLPTPGLLGMKLIDFGSDGVYGGSGSDDSSGELGFGLPGNELEVGTWISFEVPLTDFETNERTIGSSVLSSRTHLAQIIFRGEMASLFLDNVLFFRE